MKVSTKISNLFELLKNTSSTNSKIDILNDIANSEDNHLENTLLFVIDSALNPFKNYYIKQYNPNFGIDGPESIDSPKVKQLLNDLSDRTITGDAAKHLLESISLNLDIHSKEILHMIINKKLDCGIQTKTVNKVWINQIPEFNIMLCNPFNDKTVKHIKFPCLAQTKYDGARVIIIASKESVRYYARSGKEYLINNEKLDIEFKQLVYNIIDYNKHDNPETFVFDGELLCGNSNISRTESNAIATKLVRNTASTIEHQSTQIILWDYVPLENFKSGKWDRKYEDRFYQLDNSLIATYDKLYGSENDDLIKIKIANAEFMTSLDDALNFNEEQIALGEEGIILKNISGIWVNKRSKDCLKLKEILDSELRVVAVNSGMGKYRNSTGALVCESEDGIVQVNVGTGLTDYQRDEFYLNQLDIIGSIVTVRHNGLIQDVKKNYSLYLPRFVELRFDKSEADTLEKIKSEGKRK